MSAITDAVALYRRLNPRSRAVAPTTWDGSGSAVRRATCIFCRRLVATSSANWPETVRSREARETHGAACARAYLAEHGAAAVLVPEAVRP